MLVLLNMETGSFFSDLQAWIRFSGAFVPLTLPGRLRLQPPAEIRGWVRGPFSDFFFKPGCLLLWREDRGRPLKEDGDRGSLTPGSAAAADAATIAAETPATVL